MREQPLISVIVPIYRVEKYLPQCLDSLLAQTYQNFELLLIDDGSPDDCWNIMQEYARRDKRIRNFQKENGGVSSARNFGLDRVQGEYITFVDSDDFVSVQYLEGLYSALEKESTLLSVCGTREIVESEIPSRKEYPGLSEKIQTIRIEEYTYGGKGTCSRCWGVLYHRDLLQEVRFDSEIYIGEDTIFFLTAFLKARKFAYVNEKLYCYRVLNDSSYRKKFTMKQYTEILAWEQILKMVENESVPLQKSAEGLLLSAYGRVYYRMHNAGFRPELQKEILKKAWNHRKAMKYMPIRNAWEKGRVGTMLYCPHIGALVWKKAGDWQKWIKNRG